MSDHNLLEETVDAIESAKKTIADIVYIGTEGACCSWTAFALMADREYDSGFGSQNVLGDLRIIFADHSFLCRREYDGSEWWEYVSLPEIPPVGERLERVFI